MARLFASLSLSTQVIIGLSLVAIVATLDYATGVELSFSIFYFLPIIIISWFTNVRWGIFFAFVSACAWAYADYAARTYHLSDFVFIFNTIVRFGIFLTVVSLLTFLKKDSEQIAQNKLLEQRSYDVITTSQRIIVLLAKTITRYNAEVLKWIAEHKAENTPVPDIVEHNAKKIGANLASLTEVCFSFQPNENEPLDLETLIQRLETQFRTIDRADFSLHESDSDNHPPAKQLTKH